MSNICIRSVIRSGRTAETNGELAIISQTPTSEGLEIVNAPDISVCIVNWRTREALRKCLQSLAAHSAGLQLQTIVVDNASDDGSAEMVASDYPYVELTDNDKNIGYAAANNQALRAARARYKLLLNPDVTVKPGALPALLEFVQQHPSAAAVAPRLVYTDGRLQYSCRRFPTPDIILWEVFGLSRIAPRSRIFGKYRMPWWDYVETRQIAPPMASALLLNGDALDQIGPFDEDFPIFFNDVDLCYRLKQAGWEIWFTPAAEMIHEHGASTSQVKRQMIAESHRSFLRFYRKHYWGKINPIWYGLAIAALALGYTVRLVGQTLRDMLHTR